MIRSERESVERESVEAGCLEHGSTLHALTLHAAGEAGQIPKLFLHDPQ